MLDKNCSYMYRKVVFSIDNNNRVHISNKKFRNINDAIHYIDKYYIRIRKRRKLTRKQRNNAKMLARKWGKLFERSDKQNDN